MLRGYEDKCNPTFKERLQVYTFLKSFIEI